MEYLLSVIAENCLTICVLEKVAGGLLKRIVQITGERHLIGKKPT